MCGCRYAVGKNISCLPHIGGKESGRFSNLCFGKNSQLSALAYVEVIIVAVEICPLTAESLAVTS